MKTGISEECPSCSTVKLTAGGPGAAPRLSHWPIQIKLIGTVAPFLNNADLLVAADCTVNHRAVRDGTAGLRAGSPARLPRIFWCIVRTLVILSPAKGDGSCAPCFVG